MKPTPGEVCAWLVVDALGHAAAIIDRGRADDYAAAHHAAVWPMVIPDWAFADLQAQQQAQQPTQEPPL